MFSFRALACAGFALIASAVAASSHPTFTQKSAPAASSFRAVLSVPHGCEGAATTAISIWLPESILQAKPMLKPGWNIEIMRVALAHALEGPHGHKITHRVAKIVFSGGNLPDDHFDEFTFMLRLPNEAGVLHFPVEQTCGEKRRAWNEIPAPSQALSDLESPAAQLTVTRKQ